MVSVCLPSDALFSAYYLTWVSLTLDVGYLFTAGPEKHSHCSLPWTKDEGNIGKDYVNLLIYLLC